MLLKALQLIKAESVHLRARVSLHRSLSFSLVSPFSCDHLQGADKVADLWLAGIEKLLDDFSVEFPPPPPHAISPPPSPMPPMVDSPPLMAGSPPVASMPPMMPTTGGPPPDVLLICTPAGDNEQGATPPSYYMLSPDLVPVPVSVNGKSACGGRACLDIMYSCVYMLGYMISHSAIP